MGKTKKPLYIFLHLPKCAGTSIRRHFRHSFASEEILTLYDDRSFSPLILDYPDVKKHLHSLTQKEKDRTHVIIGHYVYYGIHTFFNNRDCRYITFFREPVARMLSHYNWDLSRYRMGLMPQHQKPRIFPDKNDISFNSWFKNRDIDLLTIDNYLCRYLLSFANGKKFTRPHLSNDNYLQAREILKTFYFIGMTHQPEDTLYLYRETGVHCFVGRHNVFENILDKTERLKIMKDYSTELSLDQKLYKDALRLNTAFRNKTKAFFIDKKVSIVLPNFNHGHHLDEAIQSVLGQTHQNWELLIVDDGSTDNSSDIISFYTEKYPQKIKLLRHDGGDHRGLAASYRPGFEMANGEFIAFIEADDIWENDSLAIKLEVFEKFPEVGLVYCDVEPLGNPRDIEMKKDMFEWARRAPSNRPFTALLRLLRYNIIFTFSTVMIRKPEFLIDFTQKHEAWLDWWLWAQFSLHSKFFYIPEKKTKWRIYMESNNAKFTAKISDFSAYVDSFRSDLDEKLLDVMGKKEYRLASHLLKAYREKITELDNLRAELTTTANGKDEELRQKNDEIDAFKKQTEEIINRMKQDFSDKESNLQNIIHNHENSIKTRDLLIEDKQIEIERVIHEKDSRLYDIKRKMDELEAQTNNRQIELEEKKMDLKNLITEKEKNLTGLETKYSEKCSEVENMQIYSKRVNLEKDEAYNRLEKLYCSISQELDSLRRETHQLISERENSNIETRRLCETLKKNQEACTDFKKVYRQTCPDSNEIIIKNRDLAILQLSGVFAPFYLMKHAVRAASHPVKKLFQTKASGNSPLERGPVRQRNDLI